MGGVACCGKQNMETPSGPDIKRSIIMLGNDQSHKSKIIEHMDVKKTETLVEKKCILFKIEDEVNVRPDSSMYP